LVIDLFYPIPGEKLIFGFMNYSKVIQASWKVCWNRDRDCNLKLKT